MKDNGKTISLLVDRITLLEEIEHLRYERDEAREWARRMKRERDELQRQLDEEKNKVNYIYRIGFTLPPGKWFVGGPSD